ncbi:hypothetical protein BSKO_08799 [Bryopsis sp. KO-2023]|nr:hypothetical protein BSKO_08799 [Bryopsis sp. KO-2023]
MTVLSAFSALFCEEQPAKNGDVVVAVDFGASRSAVAYTLVGDENEPVNVLRLSGADSCVHGGLKTSTSVLIEDGRVRSFGVKAEELFAECDRPSDPTWMLFKWFKMKLHEPFEEDPFVECCGGGASLRFSDILQMCLGFVKDNVLKQLASVGVYQNGDPTELFWVLTIPAIWTERAKPVMRMAAFQAGLISSEQSCHLHLALEPECAAIAAQTDPCQKRLWKTGSKFLMADCGAGTLDITAHQVVQTSPLRLKESAKPVGGPLGSMLVDRNFLEFMKSLVGREVFERFERDEPGEYIALLKEWEEKKVRFGFDELDDAWTKLNVVSAISAMEGERDFALLIDGWNAAHPTKVVESLKSRKMKLSLSFELMKSFFEAPVASVVEKIGEAAGKCNGLEYVVLSGGFANCAFLQERVRQRFAGTCVEVVVANEPDLAIVRGATMFGARPMDIVVSRKSKYTFGVNSTAVYSDAVIEHRRHRDKTVVRDGKEVLDFFSVHGRVGDDLDVTKRRKRLYMPLTPEQTVTKIQILVTGNYNVFHIDEVGVRELASIEIPCNMSLPFQDRKMFVEFSFGGTEVRCYVFDASGEREIGTVPIQFNFYH